MAAGQSSGTGGMTDLDDEKVVKTQILSNRDKQQRDEGHGLDSRGTLVDTEEDTVSNQRPKDD